MELTPRREISGLDHDASIEVELSQVKDIIPSILNTTAETIDFDDDYDEEDNSESSYKDFDWHDLPDDVREAARVLGYTKRKWNHSIPSKYEEREWKELTSEQQDAALILGHPESRWDQWDNNMGDC